MTEKKEPWEKELDKHETKRKFAVCGDCGLDDHCGKQCPNYTSADMIKEARRLLAAEDARQDKLHELLEKIREQIRLHVSPEHRPEGLFKNIQDAVYAMRGRTRLMDDAAITSALLSPDEPQEAPDTGAGQ